MSLFSEEERIAIYKEAIKELETDWNLTLSIKDNYLSAGLCHAITTGIYKILDKHDNRIIDTMWNHVGMERSFPEVWEQAPPMSTWDGIYWFSLQGVTALTKRVEILKNAILKLGGEI